MNICANSKILIELIYKVSNFYRFKDSKTISIKYDKS